jgi:hypothetical protein
MPDYSFLKGLGPLNRGKFLKISGLVLLLCLLWSVPASPAGEQRLTEQEAWVVEQVRQGQEADLQRQFGGRDGQRRLSATFLENLLLGGLKNVKIPHQGVRIAQAIIEGPLNLEYAEVGHFLSLHYCAFSHPVTLQATHFKKDLALVGCNFLEAANFKEMQVDGSVAADNAVFEKESLWCDARLSQNFSAEEVKFGSQAGKADFNGLKVGASAYFGAARFRGPVDFVCAHIGRQFDAEKAEFFQEQETANFNSMKVEQNAYFKAARFHGAVDFGTAVIGGQFNANGAEFLHPKALVNFSGIKVANTIFFQQAKFQGPVKFELAEIGVNFRGSGAEFLNQSATADLSRIKVGQKFWGDKTTIRGNVDLSYGEFYDLEINGLLKNGPAGEERSVNLPYLNLQGSQIQRELKIAAARIGKMNVGQMQVKGPAQFSNIEISSSLDLNNSTFQSIDIKNITGTKNAGVINIPKIYLGGANYNSISIDKNDAADYNDNDFQKIKQLIENSSFNTQNYVQLEAFFKRIGRESWANDIFISMQNRLTAQLPWYIRWPEWFFWGVLAGYGRAPFRVFFISLGLIVFGSFLFDPEYLTTNKAPAEGKTYKTMLVRFFLSLDRFLPIELGLAKHWDANASHFFVWFYFQLQQFLGWILLPIGLASIYTQIK